MEKVLSLVLQAIALAPGARNVAYLRDFCIDNGLDDEAIDGCLAANYDPGAVNVAMQRKKFRDDAAGPAAVKKAEKAVAEAKKAKKAKKTEKAKKAEKAADVAKKAAKK